MLYVLEANHVVGVDDGPSGVLLPRFRMHGIRQIVAAALPGVLTALSACQDTSQFAGSEALGTGSVSHVHVTGAAAAAVDGDGKFVIEPRTAWRRQLLSQGQATLLGQVYVRRIASTNASFYEKMRGARINFEVLQPCGRAYFAETPYEEPADNLPPSLTNLASPRWIVTYCEADANPSLSVAIAAAATYLSYEGPGFERSNIKGQFKGMEFKALGVPVGKTLTPSPERAVTLLAEASGKRVTAVPALVLPGMPLGPWGARWMIVQEGAVKVRSSTGDTASLRTLFVGREVLDVQLFRGLPATVNDAREVFSSGPGGASYALDHRPDMPRRFEPMEVAK